MQKSNRQSGMFIMKRKNITKKSARKKKNTQLKLKWQNGEQFINNT